MGALPARWRIVPAAAFVGGLLLACGTSQPPVDTSGFGVPIGRDSGVADGSSVNLSQSSGPASCEAGAQGDVCGCLDLDLLSDPPNIYFVLDRSGSMADDGKWNTIRNVISDLIVDLGPRARFGAAIFPDPSSSDACSTGLAVMPLRAGDSPAGTRGTTAALFIESTDVSASGGTPTATTIAKLTSTLVALPGKTFVILATDGGPNCDYGYEPACQADACTINIEGACPLDGGASCCDDNPEDCLDTQASTDALSALAAAGVPTYVVGVPGSGPYAGVLNAMALAGGESRLTDAGTLPDADDADASTPTGYYDVTSADQSAFLATLSTIAAKVTATCTLTLSAAPPDPSLVNLYLDGAVVPADPTNGWTLSGSTVTLEGSTCQEVLSGSALSLRIVAGCPTVLK